MLAFITALSFILGQADEGGDGGGLSAGNYTLVIYIVLFIAIFYFLLIRPGQKQRKAHQELVESISKGDEVMTAGGLYGKITEIRDDYVLLEVARNTEIKVSRNSVAKRESVQAEVKEEKEEKEEKEGSGASSEKS